MSDIIQNVEILHAPTSNYLLIHKNGCTSVMNVLSDSGTDLHFSSNRENNNIFWTVIRDPYERFISGLAYDIAKNYQDDFEYYLKQINFEDLFLGKINTMSRGSGNVNHTLLQSLYLFQQPIDFYVDLKNLTAFLSCHYPSTSFSKLIKNKTDTEHKKIVEKFIKSNYNIQKTVTQYLAIDNYIIDSIKNRCNMWQWQDGLMFKVQHA